jgi:putative aldouronate transport system substrate-binding protein
MLWKKGWFRTISILCIATLLTGAFSGCSGKTSQSSTGEQSTKNSSLAGQSTPVSFSWIVTYSGEQPSDNNSVIQELEKKTNTKISIQWTPMISYGDKYNVLLSSGQLPDVFLVTDLKSSAYLDAVEGNQFWNLTSYLSDSSEFPNFKNFNSVTLKNTQTDGKNYILPRERVIKRRMVCWRADWAKKAGLDAPDTIDKLYKMAKTFAAGDFDGNGKKDTIGLLLGTVSDGGGQTIDCLPELTVANGSLNTWGVRDGKVVSYVTTPEYMNTIKLLRNMHSEGIISDDFAITKTTSQVSEYIDKERAGLWLTYTIPGLQDPLYISKKKNDPNLKRSDLYGYTFMKNSSGQPRIPAETGFNCGYAISKTSVKDEAKLKQILKVMDYVCSTEGQNLVSLGINEKHFQKTGDTTAKVLNKDLFSAEVDAKTNQMSMAGGQIYDIVDDSLGEQLAKDRKQYATSDLISDASIPLISQTYATKNTSLNKGYDTALFKYILGQTNDSDFKAAIQQWKTDGGDQIAKEYTEAYQKTQSK